MAQAKLLERERVSVLMMHGWGDRVRSCDQVLLLFNRTFRNGEGLNPVSKSTIESTVRRFINHGSIKDLQRTGRPKSAGSEEMIRNAVTHFYNRIAFCQEAQGFQFEYLH